MNANIATVICNGAEKRVPLGTRLSDAFFVDAPCGGHGKCGKCKVIASGALSKMSDAERERLTEAERAAGVRLACLTLVEGDCEVRALPTAKGAKILSGGTAGSFTLSPTFNRLGVAIDVGTTTLAARLFDTSGTCLADTARFNPQISFGGDVISRIEAALGGKEQMLADCIRVALWELIEELSAAVARDTREIDRVVITGNTAMLHLLTKTSVEPLSHAPFAAKRLFGEVLPATELGLDALATGATVYLPPCIGAFVGADTTCALLASGMCERGETALLADIGTNGEMALLKDGRLTVCSTAAGPAFEGVGISMGMRGTAGAVNAATMVNGHIHATTVDNAPPVGICGSGLVDAVACLLMTEELDESGYLEDEEAMIAAPVKVTQQDIRALQLAKSAICAGLSTMLDTAHCTANEVAVYYVAGCFGSYLNMPNAERIGLFPEGLAKKAKIIGNAAIEGAAMLLLDQTLTEKATKIAQEATLLELAANPVFADHYMMGMLF